jgi:hypothetical protein
MTSNDKQSVLRIVQRCVFCTKPIEQEQPRAAILIVMPEDRNTHFQVDAHLECLRRAVDPSMSEQVNPAYFERRMDEFKTRRTQRKTHEIDD